MGSQVERYGVFYLEVDHDHQRVNISLDERNLKLMPRQGLKENYRQVTTRILHYKKAGYVVNESRLKLIHEKVQQSVYGVG
jgi:hypothetical protein